MDAVRPLSDWPSQTKSLAALAQQVETGRIPHAMLFTGQSAGISEIINYIAKMLLCEAAPAPCGTCPACLQFEAGTHPDYYVIEPAPSGAVKTADIEHVQEHLKLAAHHGGRVVYHIPGIDRATPVAANRLLKGLEEPSAPIIALMTADTLSRVLPTIRSRSFLYQLDDPEQSIAAVLEPMLQWTETLLGRKEPSLLLSKRLLDIASSASLADVLNTMGHLFQQLLRHHVDRASATDVDERLSRLSESVIPSGIAKAMELVIDAKLRLQAHVGSQSNVEQLCIRLGEVI